MTRKNFYVLVDKESNKVLSHPTKLPENWQNIQGLSSLTDEELSDLEWAGHKNFGWVKFDSEFDFDFEFSTDWLEFAKNSVKNEYANQRWENEKKGILYKGVLIDSDDRTKTAILLKLQTVITSSEEKTFSWKYNNSTFEFSSADIINISNSLNDYIQKCFDVEAELIVQVNGVTLPEELCEFNLEVTWPSNAYN